MSSGPLQELNNRASDASDKLESDEDVLYDGEVRRSQAPHGPAPLPEIVFAGEVIRNNDDGQVNQILPPAVNPDNNIALHGQIGDHVSEQGESDGDLQAMDLFGENQGYSSDSEPEGDAIDLEETSDSGRDYDSDELEDSTDSGDAQMIDYRSESDVSVSHAKEYLELLEDRLDRRLRRIRNKQKKKSRRCDACGQALKGNHNNKRGGGGGGNGRGGQARRALAF